MKVTPADITEQFDLLISGRRSREEIEAWAEERMGAEDLRLLEFEPRADQERLWGAIMYLLGVAMPSAPGEYLHTAADFEEYRRGAGF